MAVTWIGAHSNNYSAGRDGKAVQYIVLHWIVGSLTSADKTFSDGRRKASAHYGIGGLEVHQYVSEDNTAWHCGNFDFNQRSIGIEHEGGPDLPISDNTYLTSSKLVSEIATRYNIPLDREHIRGHREISATQCPGTLDIDRVIREARQHLQQHPHTGKTVTLDGAKFTELVTKATKYDELVKTHEQTLKLLRDNEKANGEKDRYLAERDATIANLNQTVNDRNADITKLNAELTTVRGQLQSAEQSRDSYQELAKQVPTLKEELEQALTDRRGAFEQLEATEKVLRGEREEKQKLIDNAPLAFWNYLLARFKRGGEK